MVQTAMTSVMVFVDREWFDDTLRVVVRAPKSNSTTPYHILIGELRDHTVDGAGVWLAGVPNPQVGDGAVMDFLVPWSQIRGVGLMPKTHPADMPATENRDGCTILKWPTKP